MDGLTPAQAYAIFAPLESVASTVSTVGLDVDGFLQRGCGKRGTIPLGRHRPEHSPRPSFLSDETPGCSSLPIILT
jgi:hypothetical protein